MSKRTDRLATPSLLDPPQVRTARVATVALLRLTDRRYSYYVPDELASNLEPGMRVTVPFGRKDRPAAAFCLAVSEQPWDSSLKPVLAAIDAAPLLNDKLFGLGQWIARYYAAPLGRTLDLMVPAAAKRRAGWRKVKYVRLAGGGHDTPADDPGSGTTGGPGPLTGGPDPLTGGPSPLTGGPSPLTGGPSPLDLGDRFLGRSSAASSRRDSAADLIHPPGSENLGHPAPSENLGHPVTLPHPDVPRDGSDGSPLPYDRGSDRAERLSDKQRAVLGALRAAGGEMTGDACRAAADCGVGVLHNLARKGLIKIETRAEPVAPLGNPVERDEPNYELNADQRNAINQIATAVAARRFSVQVLYGVTGSGKTECYVAVIRQALAEGRQAILLVPEIALTTQTVRRLQARFDCVATVHSGLSDVERSRAWAAIAAGDVPVVIGTRSAVFAPCPNLGLIVVDEEAESSYKNLAAPRYHTRDVAIKRAHLEHIPIVLGSATPSLETWRNTQERRHFNLIRLPHRVRGLAMPTVHLVDMRLEHQARRGVHLLSRDLEQHLEHTLRRGEQAVLLLNRRGFANYLHCPRCQTVVTCPHCSVHMVFHATTELAHCHYCRARLAVPSKCQTAGCGGPLVRFGIGTQRVEAEIREKFPAARLHRVDSDIMQRTADYADVLGAFERREYDILVGTQMIAKGLDFPFVSFVGVVSADTALALDDFRSEERTFQLVLQVAGRSGRGDVGGHVVVQTFAADTTAIRHAVEGNYEAFARTELARRRQAGLPPYTRMMRIILADPKMTKLRSAAEALARAIEDLLLKRGIKASLFGPRPAAIERLKDMYRWDLLLIFPTAPGLLSAIDVFKSEGTLRTGVKSVIVDVDPVSLQ